MSDIALNISDDSIEDVIQEAHNVLAQCNYLPADPQSNMPYMTVPNPNYTPASPYHHQSYIPPPHQPTSSQYQSYIPPPHQPTSFQYQSYIPPPHQPTSSQYQSQIPPPHGPNSYQYQSQIPPPHQPNQYHYQSQMPTPSHHQSFIPHPPAYPSLPQHTHSDVQSNTQPQYLSSQTHVKHHHHQPSHVDTDSDSSSDHRQSSRRERIPLMKPESYDGTGSWTLYHHRFEDCAASNRWSNTTKLQQLRYNLKGVAAEIIHKNPNSTFWSYITLTNELNKTFGPASKAASAIRIELRDRKRGKGEDLFRLRDDIYEKVSIVYGDLPMHEQQIFAVHAFVDAMTDGELIQKLIEKDPKTLSDAYDIAHGFEITKKAAYSLSTHNSKVRSVDEESGESAELTFLRGQVEELTQTVHAMKFSSNPKQAMPSPVSPTPARSSALPSPPKQKQERHRSRHIQCYSCHGWGHTSKECANNNPLN